jgi:hypothetical protein
MPKKRQTSKDEEPVGIVISRGTRVEEAPRFSAYVYGIADDDKVELEPATT